MFKTRALQWLNCLFFLAVIAMNIVAETLPLGRADTGELSQRYFSLLTPAGYAFLIWNVIYVLIGCCIVYLFRQRDNGERWMKSFTLWFILSCLFNMGWLVLWHYEYLILSFIAMVLLLITVAATYRLTRKIEHPTRGETWFLRLPFSLYSGWTCIATLVNLQVVIEHSGLSINLPKPAMAITLLFIGTLAVILIGSVTRDGAHPLPVAWGYAAIAFKHREEQGLFFTAGLAAAILLVFALGLLFISARDRD
ncbi:TspO/MBR related protein [Fontibacillus phaseoli]|uniref:TspO/MBR related protein n=1 Tax=Fontibacillus phaseoli TaxID=1416533 RepID=A0A369AW04_9BACL|nr:TspO/MBR family protein [Fontibacillus phaseoli]RCX13590.1 TspO/MBR related protein [Fontibacillus phaseoli]